MESIAAGRAGVRAGGSGLRPGWIALDSAANIFPSTVGRINRHLYRFVFTLHDPVDAEALQKALDAVAPRFPSIVARLRVGARWFALEPVRPAPRVTPAPACPMPPMSLRELRSSCLRVQYDGRRIMVEFFHALCDGYGAMVFLKTLTAAYVSIRYGVDVPCADGVLDVKAPPDEQELGDSYLRYAGKHALKRDLSRSYRLSGTPTKEQALTITDLCYDESAVCAAAKRHGVSVTAFATAVMAQAMLRLQKEERPRRPKPVRVSVPVNLRQFFPTQTLRNFSLCAIVEIDPLMGEWTFPEICEAVQHQMKLLITRKEMAAAIATNVQILEHPLFRCLPLFVKTPLLRLGYRVAADRTACIGVSNLGRVTLPEPMRRYVRDVFCTPDASPYSPCSCVTLTYGGRVHVGMCRCMREDKVARAFDAAMRKALGARA